MPQRLPIVDGDDGEWGTILNQYLSKEHYDTGVDNAANGGHKTVTIRPGTTAAGTAPLKFTAGPLMTTPEAGAVEFNGNQLYFTHPTATNRRTVATVPTNANNNELLFYNNGLIELIPEGSDGQVLTLDNGPTWMPVARSRVVTAVFGDSVNVGSVAAGSVCYVPVPYSGIITKWSIVAINGLTSCTIDVWKRNAAVPTVAQTITAAAKPSASGPGAGNVYNSSLALTGWTIAVSANDVFGFKLDSVVGSVTSIVITLEIAAN